MVTRGVEPQLHSDDGNEAPIVTWVAITTQVETMGIEPNTRSLQKILAPLVHVPPEEIIK